MPSSFLPCCTITGCGWNWSGGGFIVSEPHRGRPGCIRTHRRLAAVRLLSVPRLPVLLRITTKGTAPRLPINDCLSTCSRSTDSPLRRVSSLRVPLLRRILTVPAAVLRALVVVLMRALVGGLTEGEEEIMISREGEREERGE